MPFNLFRNRRAQRANGKPASYRPAGEELEPRVVLSTFYIANTGNDNNVGTDINAPWASLNKAINSAKAGDTVLVRGGTYSVASWTGHDGAAGAPITFRAYQGEHPVISGQEVDLWSNYVVLDGFEIKNSSNTGLWVNGSHDQILNCTVHDSQSGGILVGKISSVLDANGNVRTDIPTDVLVQGCTVYNNALNNAGGKAGSWAACLTTFGASNVRFINNVSHHNWGEGLDLFQADNVLAQGNTVYDNWNVNLYIDNATNSTVAGNFIYNDANAEIKDGYGAAGIQIATENDESFGFKNNPIHDDKILNNIVVNTKVGLFYPQPVGTTGGMKNFTIANNTFYGGSFFPILIWTDTGTTGTVVENNIFAEAAGGPQPFTYIKNGITWQNNLWSNDNPTANVANGSGSMAGPGDVNADAQFVNPGGLTSADYKLKSTSPAIDKGLNLAGLVNRDFFGTARPQASAYDIGAYEFPSGAPVNQAPQITAASASPATVTGTFTTLSAAATDDGGAANLTYAWTSSGPAAVTFANPAAASTTATFTKAGAYTFTVTVKDAGGLTASKTVNVTVNQTLSSIKVTPATASVAASATQQFSATALDQFGAALATQPAVTWSVTNAAAKISSTGLYTAPGTAGSDTVKATSGTVSGSATVTVTAALVSGQVNLAGAFNRVGIVNDGSSFTGGLDGSGTALSANLLGSTVIWNGQSFALGTPGTNNVVSAKGQTITLPAGNHSSLQLLAGGVNGNQANLAFTVHYTDGTSQTFTQSVSDWFTAQNYAGEAKAVATSYRDTSTGGRQDGPFNVYGYSFTLNSAKTVQSVTLPNDANVEILAMNVVQAATASTNAATFAGTDTTTQGSWIGKYGLNGHFVANDSASFPAWASVSTSGASSLVWTANTWSGLTYDPRALQKADASNRMAAGLSGSTITVDVNLTDGKAHNVSLYLLDWFAEGRSERIDVIDPATGKVLDSQTASSFSGGQYLTWSVTGHVQFRITSLAGPNAVLSGLFV